MHIALLIILVVGLSVLGSVGLVMLVRRTRRGPALRGTEDVEGIYIVAIDALYAIFIAFMIFVVWMGFDAATNTVDQEADTLVDIYRLAEALPQPLQDDTRQAAIDYANMMIDEEWPAMARVDDSQPGQVVVDRLWWLINIQAGTQVEDAVLRDRLLTELSELTDLRRYRLLQSRTRLPSVLYVVLIFGGILTVAFAAVFSVDKFVSHALKAAALAALISLMLLTIYMLDHPFGGGVRVSPDAFVQAREMMESGR